MAESAIFAITFSFYNGLLPGGEGSAIFYWICWKIFLRIRIGQFFFMSASQLQGLFQGFVFSIAFYDAGNAAAFRLSMCRAFLVLQYA